MLDPTGHVASWNQGAERIKGYNARRNRRPPLLLFLPSGRRAEWQTEGELQRAIAEGRYEEEGWRIRKDGSRFWADVVITALTTRLANCVDFPRLPETFRNARRRSSKSNSRTANWPPQS